MRSLKKIAPRSLYGRFLLIIILPAVLTQAIAVYMFYERHWSSMTRNLASSLSGEISYIAHRVEQTDKASYPSVFSAIREHLDIEVALEGNDALFTLPIVKTPDRYTDFELYTRDKFTGREIMFAFPKGGRLTVRLMLADGKYLYISPPYKRLANPTTYIFILWMTGSAALLMFVAIIFLKNQIRSIVRLTRAAELFGRGQDLPDFKPQGAKEVRRAAMAFIEMRERIKRLLTRRTQMLAGVSHDLRTPLTRMRLQLELMPESSEIAALKDDIREMEQMLDGYLDFARGETAEQSEVIVVDKFLQDILAAFRHNQDKIHMMPEEGLTIHGQPLGLKRCLDNLISNGLRYGTEVWISVSVHAGQVMVHVEDNGSGIPPQEYENVFQPFYRLEQSRNSHTGGVGLGLAIARDIAHKHGGEIILAPSDHGGLKATLQLPQ